ncbi:hypothetical protein VIGAN_08345100 [Vigna angularis var. angularis]|uniref:Uncharacterized protein n=1 Tax=Vigna angularis var. angularis TaxID=157739 RepID=A0A0S3SUG0_PHAAN|nr:hypothetical protein VIGAN_08345100 [Vigna angularis var. angularis]
MIGKRRGHAMVHEKHVTMIAWLLAHIFWKKKTYWMLYLNALPTDFWHESPITAAAWQSNRNVRKDTIDPRSFSIISCVAVLHAWCQIEVEKHEAVNRQRFSRLSFCMMPDQGHF